MSCFYLDSLQLKQNHKETYIICALVFGLHCLFFGFLAPAHTEKPKRVTKLAVRTVTLTPKNVHTAPKTCSAAPPVIKQEKIAPLPVQKDKPIQPRVETKQEKKSAPKQVHMAAKPATKKTVKPAPKASIKPQSTPKQETDYKQEQLIASALASLDRLTAQQRSIAPSKTKQLPSHQIDSLAVDSLIAIESEGEQLIGREKSYYDELVQRLKLHLRLPECGDVKIRLTLRRNGKVVKVECNDSKSQKNSAHLKKVLPTLTFPPFGQNFTKEEQHTFFLHFSNDFS